MAKGTAEHLRKERAFEAVSRPEIVRIPVICVDPSTVFGAEIFNSNLWPIASKGIVNSCLAEFSVLHHCVGQIGAMCKDSDQLCQNQIATLQNQWASAKFDLEKVVLFGEQPDLHIRIEAFFAGVKSLLDLIVQLLSTEEVVTIAINGFHREKKVYGGTVLNALQNNAPKDKKELAGKIHALLTEHKGKWIDQLISARDLLIHPKQGMPQLMPHFDCTEKDGKLVCTRISPPVIDKTPIDQYAQRTLSEAKVFCVDFIALVQQVIVSTT